MKNYWPITELSKLDLTPRIFYLNKPVDITCNRLLTQIKRKLPRKMKIGHFGTLDPFATGLVIVAINQATRFNEFVHEEFSKTYIATGLLGVETDSGDSDGEITQEDKSVFIDELEKGDQQKLWSQVQENYLGEYWQSPHPFSASKFEGKALHEWARKEGKIIEKPKVRREILELELISWKNRELKFRVTVSSGTFIRGLMCDIAKIFGTVGHLTGLHRSAIGPAEVPEKTFNQDDDLIELEWQRPWELLDYPKLKFTADTIEKYSFGQSINFDPPSMDHQYYWVADTEKCYGLASSDGELLRPKVNFLATNLS